MAKLWLLSIFCLAALMQLTFARDLADVLDDDARAQLKGYQSFLETDDGTHKEELQKLISIYESVLTASGAEAKQAVLKDLSAQFTPEFNKYIAEKLHEYQLNDSIQQSIEFYQSLRKSADAKYTDEIERTIATLESLLKETDLKEKETKYATIEPGFSAEFREFLKTNNLPVVNKQLQSYVEFFENLLVQPDIKYETEIKELKTQAEAALSNDVTVEQKQTVLYQVINPQNKELLEFLQKKFVEMQ